jgi:hypothetical protein
MPKLKRWYIKEKERDRIGIKIYFNKIVIKWKFGNHSLKGFLK